jgi:hypothetical protein
MRSLFVPSWRRELLQYCVRVHHPNAVRVVSDEEYRSPGETNLIVEPALLIEKVKEFRICFASPEIKVTYFEVAPNYSNFSQRVGHLSALRRAHNGIGYRFRRHHQIRRP